MSQSDISYEDYEYWAERRWSDWLPLNKDAVRTVPPLPGVYEVRTKNYSFPRLQGQTSTIYIGKAEKRELAMRLGRLVRSKHAKGSSGDRIGRVRNVLQKELEFRFRVALDAEGLERDLLAEYDSQHLELPPCNHNLPREGHQDVT